MPTGTTTSTTADIRGLKGRIWKTGYDNTGGDEVERPVPALPVKGEPVASLSARRGDGRRARTASGPIRNGQLSDADIDMSVLAGKDVLFSTAAKDADGNIYIGTRGRGIFRVPRGSRRMERYAVDVFGTDLNTAKVWSILSDRNGNLWIGLQLKGLVLVPQRPMQFKNWSFRGPEHQPGLDHLLGVRGRRWHYVVYGAGRGCLWLRQPGPCGGPSPAPDAVEFIFRDQQHRYWIGTDDGLFSYDPLTGQSQQKVTVDCDKFNDMTSDDRATSISPPSRVASASTTPRRAT